MGISKLTLDDQGRIVLPVNLREKLGAVPGGELYWEEGRNSLLIHSSVSRLSRVYLEPTSLCNLECATCIRNVWEEEVGNMSRTTFLKILAALDVVQPVPEIFFGGFGEPLSHPDIFWMIEEAKQRGAHVELISNGILLTEETSLKLVDLELDRLWVSIDGASPESYEDVRLGDQLPLIKKNLKFLKELRRRSTISKPATGITFVAMKRNLKDLPAVHKLMYELGGDILHVSNVLPHTPEMNRELLYTRGMHGWSEMGDKIIFPRIDINEENYHHFDSLFARYEVAGMAGSEFQKPINSCPFVDKGSVSVRWDGEVSPCLPLIHTSDSYFKGTPRRNDALSFGNLGKEKLMDIWHGEEYRNFRDQVKIFDFSPCVSCTGCEMSETNEEDCYGSSPVSCGGCLWAQGFIQCP